MAAHRLCVWSLTAAAAFALLAFPAEAPARGETVEITPMVGTRFGGSFRDTGTDAKLKVDEHAAFSLAIDIAWDRNTELEIYLSRQPTRLTSKQPVAPGALFDIDIDYYHIGGTYLFGPSGNVQPYFLATLGLSRFKPRGAGLESETNFSFSTGAGWKVPLTRRIGLRLEGRGFFTFMDSERNVFCDLPGACNVKVRGNTFNQWDVSAGLIFRF
ncbi:MAG: outer membrane beta-barrel protein [Burkholderiales bacterium]